MGNCWRTLAAVVLLIAGTTTAYVNYEYFEGTWDALPDFDSLVPNVPGWQAASTSPTGSATTTSHFASRRTSAFCKGRLHLLHGVRRRKPALR